MKILIVVNSSKTYNHNNVLILDRVDLTRKLDCLNTWVEDALNSNIKVIFLNGGSTDEFFDRDSLTLNLNVDDSYEVIGSPSNLLPKVLKGFEWIIKNEQFDLIYLCDDDVYINIEQFLKNDFNYDFISNGSLGGSGFFFSKVAVQHLLEIKNVNHSNADTAIYSHMVNNSYLKIKNNMISFCPQYFPGELFSTIHYVSGKRSYFFHHIIKNFRDNKITNRKIILFFPLDTNVENEFITYESSENQKTKRWYDFIYDCNGWEYHGGYTRSSIDVIHLKQYWPYGKRSTKYYVINYDFVQNNLNFIVTKCEESLINPKNVFLVSKNILKIDGWVIDNSLREFLNLTFETLITYNIYKKLNYE